MWVPATRKEWLVGALAALLGVLGLTSLGYHTGKEDGIKHGIAMYHHMCYTNGPGFIIIGNEAVLCSPGGKLSGEEQKQLDKGVKAWYHKYLKE
jgi:hypothetical protein